MQLNYVGEENQQLNVRFLTQRDSVSRTIRYSAYHLICRRNNPAGIGSGGLSRSEAKRIRQSDIVDSCGILGEDSGVDEPE